MFSAALYQCVPSLPGVVLCSLTSFLLDHPLVLAVWGKHVAGGSGARMLLELAFGRHVSPQCWGMMTPQRMLFEGMKGMQRAPGKGSDMYFGRRVWLL